MSDFWRVARVDCQSDGTICPADLWAELTSKSIGKNILLFSIDELSQEISQSHPEYFQITIKRQLPDKILFTVVVRRAMAVLRLTNGSFYLTDKEGFILEKTDKIIEYPLIDSDQSEDLKVRQKIQDQVILKAIEIVNESKLRLLEPEKANSLSPRAIEVNFKDGLQVFFSTEKNSQEQLDTLQFILDRTKIEGEKLSRIDLRFDKPVLVE